MIGTTAVESCFSTPDMGSEPEKIDVTSFDDIKNKKYIEGLSDVQSFNFDFYDTTANFNVVHAKDGAENSYSLEYPDGSKYSWSGTHRSYKLSAAVGGAIKFRVSCTVNSEIAYTEGTEKTGTESSGT